MTIPSSAQADKVTFRAAVGFADGAAEAGSMNTVSGVPEKGPCPSNESYNFV